MKNASKKNNVVSLKDVISGKGAAVEAAIAKHAATKAADEKAKKPAKTPRAKLTAATKARDGKETKASPAKETIASVMRELIMAGKNNEDVFLGAQKRLGEKVVTEEKRWFAAWYRADMKRKGEKNVPASVPHKKAAAK